MLDLSKLPLLGRKDDSREIDHYEICRYENGWVPVEDWDDLNQPFDSEVFEWNEAPLDPGTYCLFPVDSNGSRFPSRWTLEVEEEEEEDEETETEEMLEEIETLREKIREREHRRRQQKLIEEMLKPNPELEEALNESIRRKYS